MQSTGSALEFRQILGLRFFVGDARSAIERLSNGGLLVVPAAPALRNLAHDVAYREALLGADIAITDSSLMVMLWNLLQRDNIRRLSGLEYLAELLKQADVREQGRCFWIMPNPGSAARNLAWLRQQGIAILPEDVYIAPLYQNVIEDQVLLQAVRERQPAHIIVGLGVSSQEKLGLYLK